MGVGSRIRATLTGLLTDPFIEEIFIEGGRVTFIDGSGRLRALVAATNEEENRQVVDRLLAGTNRRLDASNAIEQARVLDGEGRLTAVVPPVADRLSVTLRKYTVSTRRSDRWWSATSLTPEAAAFLWVLAQASMSVLISGATGAGKTTMLSAWLRAIPDDRASASAKRCARSTSLPPHSSAYGEPGDVGSCHATGCATWSRCAWRRASTCSVSASASRGLRADQGGQRQGGFACTVHANSARCPLRHRQCRPDGRRERTRAGGAQDLRPVARLRRSPRQRPAPSPRWGPGLAPSGSRSWRSPPRSPPTTSPRSPSSPGGRWGSPGVDRIDAPRAGDRDDRAGPAQRCAAQGPAERRLEAEP